MEDDGVTPMETEEELLCARCGECSLGGQWVQCMSCKAKGKDSWMHPHCASLFSLPRRNSVGGAAATVLSATQQALSMDGGDALAACPTCIAEAEKKKFNL